MVILVDGDVTFDLFEARIRRIGESGSVLIKIMCSLKCETLLSCAMFLVRRI